MSKTARFEYVRHKYLIELIPWFALYNFFFAPLSIGIFFFITSRSSYLEGGILDNAIGEGPCFRSNLLHLMNASPHLSTQTEPEVTPSISV